MHDAFLVAILHCRHDLERERESLVSHSCGMHNEEDDALFMFIHADSRLALE